ncbi:alpha/beta hydrolase [Nocardia sp. NPDC051030]|uniref:alpha/beta fold hydrolase n=1 Tax=Nocardia sp. NPDC051030 TaxID=3155162 RepID=UPI00342F52CE
MRERTCAHAAPAVPAPPLTTPGDRHPRRPAHDRRFELYRALDKDVSDTVADAPTDVPTLLMTAQGQLDPIRATVAPRMTNIVWAVDVPHAGHWLVEENPEFVTAELLRFLDE